MEAERYVGTGHMTTEAEVEMVQLQVKECWELLRPPEARKRQEHSSLQTSEGTWPCWYPNFQFLASRTVRE